ncbi:hypothetical protein ACSS6W_004942 [Trichoderma asperelloides]
MEHTMRPVMATTACSYRQTHLVLHKTCSPSLLSRSQATAHRHGHRWLELGISLSCNSHTHHLVAIVAAAARMAASAPISR